MLKTLGLTAVFSFIWLNAMPKIARSELPSERSETNQEFAIESNVGNDLPFCYIQTVEGGLIDLTRFCGHGMRRQQTALAPIIQPAETAPAIVIPSAPSNGRACIVFDQQGRPCAANQ